MNRHLRRGLLAALAGCLPALVLAQAPAPAQPTAANVLTIASTTSTEQSGLLKHILPKFKERTGIEARVVAVGSGQALDIGRRGDADLLLVHDREAEQKFLAEGHGVERREVFYNDFIVVGPAADPARIKGTRDVVGALRAIERAKAPFVSRGDRSGTHAAELRYWAETGIDPSTGKGSWYREVGQGMGPALNTAAASGAHTLADRGTWLSFRNRQDMILLLEGDPRLFNQYGVMLVNPQRHAHVKAEAGRRFIDWISGTEGQAAVAEFRINGEQLFFPNYRR